MESSSESLCEVELLEDTMIVTPNRNLREFESDHIEEEAKHLRKLWETKDVKNVIVDFHRTDYFGSSALGLLVELWNQVKSRKGQMGVCGVSEHEKDIFTAVGLDHLWLASSSREEALKIIKQRSASQSQSDKSD